MKTVAEAMEYIRNASTIALGAIDKELLVQAIQILKAEAQDKGTDLDGNDSVAQSLKAANAMAALLGITEPRGEFVDPSSGKRSTLRG